MSRLYGAHKTQENLHKIVVTSSQRYRPCWLKKQNIYCKKREVSKLQDGKRNYSDFP